MQVSALTETRPAYRKPWTFGAKAYPEADNLAAIVTGTKRARNPLTVRVPHAGLVDERCACCGLALDAEYPVSPNQPDTLVRDESGMAMVDYDPRTKRAIVRHYYCAWAGTIGEVLDLGRRMGLIS